MLFLASILLLPIGIIGMIIFQLGIPYNSNQSDHYYFWIVLYMTIVILVSNTGWAVVPSMLSSRFGTYPYFRDNY